MDSNSELILFMARNLVEDPSQVSVSRQEREKGVVYELRVGARDLGKVIGKNGKTARSMRAVLSAHMSRKGERAQLEIQG
ncbi:MAG: KH domain-containing protein [Candidatus Eisenbacteria bacterium]|nr:KH domain-containing protein [Candidatus Eisenbacteria bacterium]